MPFKSVTMANYNQQDKTESWTLRIHIDYHALFGANSTIIEQIADLLKEKFTETLNSNLFITDNLADYDGALSTTGKNRTALGKEVCIDLPAANSAYHVDYKTIILELWKKLQDLNVPLLHINVPGDQSIMIDDANLPSPFSFTSNNPKKEDDILFKTFEAFDASHPILNVKISTQDLTTQGISIDQSREKSHVFYVEHQRQVNNFIQSQLAKIDQETNFKDFLFNDEVLNTLKSMGKHISSLTNHKQKLNFLDQHPDYQRLINSYPPAISCFDGSFGTLLELTDIGYEFIRGSLEIECFKSRIDELRKGYDDSLKDIKTKFKTLNITFEGYDVDALIEKNPRAMYCIYRNKCLIQQEIQANRFLEATPIITSLEKYKLERNSFDSVYYYPLLSWLFGGWSKQAKLDAVDALIAHIKDPSVVIDPIHFGPLQQGNLGNLVRIFNIELNSSPHQTLSE